LNGRKRDGENRISDKNYDSTNENAQDFTGDFHVGHTGAGWKIKLRRMKYGYT